ncbi:MAG: replicative DNA helicase [Clostridia bacterium]|nr:replicative DNA helicase [Clostridia bacterium]
MAEQIKRTRAMPGNIEAERAILGCILFDADLGADLLAELNEEDFYSKAHKQVFEGMKKLYLNNQPVDLVTLTDILDSLGYLDGVGGVSYLTDLETGIASTANYAYYLEIVKRDSVMRKLIRASREISELCLSEASLNEAVAFAEKSVFDVSARFDTSTVVPISETLVTVLESFNQATQQKGKVGITTGFHQLDRILNGLHRTDLVLVAARPGMGKTALALNIVSNAALSSNATCAIFSLEMGKEQLTQRMVCSQAKVSMAKAVRGELKREDWLRIWQANQRLRESKIFIDESTLITPAEMISKCRRIKARHGLDLVMVDYIQLMQSGKRSDSRQQEVSEISRMLKILAKELDVPVIALSQLSRDIEKRTDKRPQLSDLRESGAIEQDADIILFINRPEEQKGEKLDDGTVQRDIADIYIAKHRNGETGMIKLAWMGESTLFANNDTNIVDAQAEAYGVAPMRAEPKVIADDNLPFEDSPEQESKAEEAEDVAALTQPIAVWGDYDEEQKAAQQASSEEQKTPAEESAEDSDFAASEEEAAEALAEAYEASASGGMEEPPAPDDADAPPAPDDNDAPPEGTDDLPW